MKTLRFVFYVLLVLAFMAFVLMDLYIWLSATFGPVHGGVYASLIQTRGLLITFHAMLFVFLMACLVALCDLTRRYRRGEP
jgi:hypothetical protein